MITATTWVPRGAPAEHPIQIELDESELTRISELTNMELESAETDLMEAQNSSANPPQVENFEKNDDELKEFNMDDYDMEVEQDKTEALGGVHNLAYYKDGEQDEYLSAPTELELKEEKEELQILPTDNLILSTKTEDDLSILEVYVYDDSEASLYVHHDIPLPSFPLCLEWIPLKPKTNNVFGNFVAIGTFDPEIELWDLDQINGVYPQTVLGKPAKKKAKKINNDFHIDAVLSLSSNKVHSNMLASGSADKTIKLWDLESCKAALSLEKYHQDKVSCVEFNPTEASVLLSGGYDKVVKLGDIRSANIAKECRTYQVNGDVETCSFDGDYFYVGVDNGRVLKFDARSASKPLWTLQAHDNDLSYFCKNKFIDNMMVTCGDHQVKLWNLNDNKPSMVLSRNFDVGKVFSVNFGPEFESRSLLSIGGAEGSLKVWDAFSNKAVRQAFGGPEKKFEGERLVEVESDGESDTD